MLKYLFVFGRTPKLASLELASFFRDFRILSEGLALVQTDKEFDSDKMIGQLGGTVKIGLVGETVKEVNPVSLANFLEKSGAKRIIFGISSYFSDFKINESLLSQIKDKLETDGFSGRFVSGKNGEPLTSVVVEKQKIKEIILIKEEDSVILAETVAVQPFEDWNRRDYGRPFADPHAGMLPPKVARMAVNIAQIKENGTLLDPFCGMGTILAEALLSGFKVIGSDQSPVVVKKTEANLEWLVKDYAKIHESQINLFVSEATHVSEKIEPCSVDAVVTEPFMGANRENQNQIEEVKNIIKGLEKLYIGCLKDWSKVLKPEGRVVMALPEYAMGNRTLFVKNVIDNCENLGYTVQTGPIEYSRPQATVRRKFYILTKHGTH